MAGDGITKITDLKEELTSLHTVFGGMQQILQQESLTLKKVETLLVLTFQDAVDCRL